MMSLIGKCQMIAGCPRAGTVLYVIDYWRKRRKTSFVIRSRSELAEDIGFSLRQIDRGLAKLSKLGLIEREKHIRKGKNILHTRVTERAIDLLRGRETVNLTLPETVSPSLPLPANSSDTTYLSKETADDTPEICAPKSATRSANVIQVNFRKQGNLKEDDVNTDEVLAAVNGKSPKSKKTSTGKVDWQAVWQQAWTPQYGFCPPLTLKARGQLKMFAGKCPSHDVAIAAVEKALSNWPGFVSRVKTLDGLKDGPANPHSGFLLAHVAAALDFAKTAKPAAQPAKKIKMG